MDSDKQNYDGNHLSEEPLEVKVFYSDDVVLIDSRNFQQQIPRQRQAYAEPRQRPLLAIGLFIASCLSTFFMGIVLFSPNLNKINIPNLIAADKQNGLTYSIAVMTILLFHEMGHYLQSKRYGIPASFPYFIPMPFNPFGTMGAVILQGSGVANRKSLFDVAISGPLAGLVIALPCVFYGIKDASIIEVIPDPDALYFGTPLIIDWIADWYHGPIPTGFVVELNPLFFAGWVGIFITALNLIPIGQLDGGHVLYTLIGKRAHLVARLLLYFAVGMMIYSQKPTYMIMVILLYIMGTKHPPTQDDSIPLGKGRVILGWITLAFIVIGFTTDPLMNPADVSPKKEVEEEPDLVWNFNSDEFEVDNKSKLINLPNESDENLVFLDEPGKSYSWSFPNR